MPALKRLLKGIAIGLIGLSSVYAGRLLHQHLPLTEAAATWKPWEVSLILLLVLPSSMLLAVGLHEAGHAWAGRWLGFRFYWLVVGPFRWERRGEGVHFCWNTQLYAAGGLVLSIPTTSQELRSRYLAFIAAGPLASFIWAAIALGGFYLLHAPGENHWGALVLGISAGTSVLIGIGTLVPLRWGGVVTDGARLLSLGRNGCASRVEMAVLGTMARAVAGVRPREWALAELKSVRELPDTLPSKPYVYYYLYLAALDAGQVNQAGQLLAAYRRCLPWLPASLHGSVWLESAFFVAAYEGDLPAARAMQAQATPSALTPPDLLPRVLAAEARLAGKAHDAGKQAQLALREQAHSIDPGSQYLYAEWLTSTVSWAIQAQAQADKGPFPSSEHLRRSEKSS